MAIWISQPWFFNLFFGGKNVTWFPHIPWIFQYSISSSKKNMTNSFMFPYSTLNEQSYQCVSPTIPVYLIYHEITSSNYMCFECSKIPVFVAWSTLNIFHFFRTPKYFIISISHIYIYIISPIISNYLPLSLNNIPYVQPWLSIS